MARSTRLTSRDVAKASGVSQTTVSRVMRGERYVGDDVRERVLRAMDELGYVGNAAARMMRTREAGSIGVVAGRITSPFYPELLDALSRVLAETRLKMTLWVDDEGRDPGALEAIDEGLIDGVIFTTVTANSTALRSALERQAPVLLLNRTIARLPVDSVISDNREGAEEAAELLLGLGHSRMGLISGRQDISTTRHREQGFRKVLADAGVRVEPDMCIRPGFDHAAGRRAIHSLLSRKLRPTAVFCVNDMIAFGAIDGAREMGFRVPDDLSVIGCDDLDLASWPSYDLTTIRQSTDELARSGVELLVERVRATEALEPRRVVLPTELIVRGSTAPPGAVGNGSRQARRARASARSASAGTPDPSRAK